MKISIIFQALTGSFETDVKRAEKSVEKAAKKMREDMREAGKVIGQAVAIAGAAIAILGKKAIDTADNLYDLSKRVGISTEILSAYKLAAEQSGTSLDSVAKGMQKLAKEASGQAKTLKAMGIEAKNADGSIKDLNQLMREVADKFASYEDGAAKAALAQKLFGKTGTELLPFFENGAAGLDEMTQKAKRFGLVVSKDLAEGADQFNDHLHELGSLLEGIMNDALKELLPLFNDLLQELVDGGLEFKELGIAADLLINSFKGVVLIGTILKNGIETLVGYIGAAGTLMVGWTEGWWSLAKAIGTSAEALAKFYGGDFKGAAQTVLAGSQELAQDFTEIFNEARAAIDAAQTGAAEGIADVSNMMERLYSPAAKEAANETKRFGDEQRKAKAPVLGLTQEVAKSAKELKAQKDALKAGALAAVEAAGLWLQAKNNARAAIKEANGVLANTIAGLKEEIKYLGMSSEAARVYEIVQRDVAEAKQLGIKLSPQQQQAHAEEVAGLLRVIDAMERQRDAAMRMQQIVGSGFSSMTDAIAAFATGSINSLSDLGKSLVGSVKQMVGQMIAEFLKLRFVEPLIRGLFSGGGGGFNVAGMFGGATASGGLNLGNVLGSFMGNGTGSGTGLNWMSLFGGNGGLFGGTSGALNASAAQSYGVLATPTGTAGAGLGLTGSLLAGLGGAFYGYGRTNGGAPGVAAAASYGALGIGVAGTAAGIAGGLGVGAAAGGAFSALGAAAAIPVVGWILAALAFIDLASGGKLFGTKFRPEEATQALQVSPEGGQAVTTVRDVRNRSLFRGRQWRTRTIDSSDEAVRAAQELFDRLADAMEGIARQMETEVAPMIDGAIRTVQKYDKKGKPKGDPEIFVDVLGRTWKEADAEHAQMRLTAEAMIAQVAAAFETAAATADPIVTPEMIADLVTGDLTPEALERAFRSVTIQDAAGGGGGRAGTGAVTGAAAAMMSEVHQIAERWRDDAEQLLAGAQFLVAAGTDLRRGVGLLGDDGTLTQITDLVEDLQHGGEALAETYARAVTATGLLEDALSLAGVELDRTREEFVRFAVDIADAAGGIAEAQALWQAYFQTAYTAAERAQLALADAQTTANDMLSGIGLDPETTMAEFRAAFESALPTLDAADIVEWLRAAQAITQLQGAEAELAAIRDAEAAAAAELASMLENLNAGPMTEFGADIEAISNGVSELSARADALARAAGRAGASQEELAEITRWAARQFELAVDRLEQRIRNLATELYGTELGRIEAEINTLTEQHQAAQQAADAAAQAAQARYEQELQYIKQIQAFVDSLMLSALSPLNPEQQFREAQAQFNDLLALARGGNVDALGQLQGAAQAVLEQGRSFFGPSDQYTALFESITGALSALGVTGSPGGQTVTLVPSDELNALFARREQILLEQEQANRQALAEALAIQLGELSAATSTSAITLAEQMGVSLTALIADLGIGLDDLSTSTAQELADVARTLNLSVADLAGAVGASLGELTDTTSLLNDAFEADLASLPEGIQEELWPLLRAVEDAVTDADANAAIDTLRSTVDELAPELRDELAPYLGLSSSLVEPIEDVLALTEQQVDLLTSMDESLAAIREALAPAPTPESTPAAKAIGPGELVSDAAGTASGSVDTLLRQLIAEVRLGADRQSRAIEFAANRLAQMAGRGF